MHFGFSDEQLMFRDSIRGFLATECTAERVRALWDTETGRAPELWSKLAGLGVLGMLAPEEHGGLGMDEIDLVLALEESGRAALPDPLVETAAVAVPLLRDCGDGELQAEWLPRIGAGEAIVTVAHQINPAVADAHVADLILIQHGQEIHAVPREVVTLTEQPCLDRSRRLFTLRWLPGETTRRLASGADGQVLLDAAFDRAALGTAAQQLGIAAQLLHLAVEYAKEREQFDKPIGSFQAIKHMLANVAVRIEFARPVVYRAAFSVARNLASRAIDVSQAKSAACEAAIAAAKAALQVHGAIGYTWEVDLHLWMKRAWALDAAWGTRLWHRARVGAAVIEGPGPAPSFGFEART